MAYLAALASRYAALAIQFGIVLLVTRTLPQDEAGRYFLSFGIVATLFCLAGGGLPDGLVKTLGEDIAAGRRGAVRRTIHRAGRVTLATGAALVTLAATLAIALGLDATQVGLTALWGLCSGLLFFVAQILVALRHAGAGSFFFYGATNAALLITSLPYLALAARPTLTGLLLATAMASALALALALVTLGRRLRPYPAQAPGHLLPAFRAGLPMAAARVLQAMLYWIPVWVAGARLGAAEASVLATAGRLLIAVSALIAALRFSVRPAVVAAAAAGDWPEIKRTGRNLSLLATLATLAAMAGLLGFGQPVLTALFGPEYAGTWALLLILLVGALAEAVGGPVDEILKMTGHAPAVLLGLIVAAGVETALALAFAGQGLAALAWGQSLAFCGLYAFQIHYLRRVSGVLILPGRALFAGRADG